MPWIDVFPPQQSHVLIDPCVCGVVCGHRLDLCLILICGRSHVIIMWIHDYNSKLRHPKFCFFPLGCTTILLGANRILHKQLSPKYHPENAANSTVPAITLPSCIHRILKTITKGHWRINLYGFFTMEPCHKAKSI